MGYWQGFGKGSSKLTFVVVLLYVCHIEDTKHIPREVPALIYLTAFEHAGTLTRSWKSFVIWNPFSSQSFFKGFPGGWELRAQAAEAELPTCKEDSPGGPQHSLPAPWWCARPRALTDKKEICKATRVQCWAGTEQPLSCIRLSHFHLQQLRIWFLIFNLAWISAGTNFVFLIHNHRQSPAKLFWYLNLFTVPRLLVVMTH